MAENDFIMAVDPGGNKRLVPAHYLDNPAFGFKLPPSDRAKDPTQPEFDGVKVQEPATPATTTVTEPAAPEKKEARS